VQTAGRGLAGWLVEASRIGGWLQRALLFVLAPLAPASCSLLSPRREFAADRAAPPSATRRTASPDALVRLEQANELVEFQASPSTEPLYTVNPFEPVGIGGMFSPIRRLGERVAACAALDPDWRRSSAPPSDAP
jgi:Zn-dependent protease with chaperone function